MYFINKLFDIWHNNNNSVINNDNNIADNKNSYNNAAKMNCYFLFENLCEDFIFSAKKSLAKFNGTPFVRGHPS